MDLKPVTTPADIALTAALGEEIWHEHYDSLIGVDQVNYMLDRFQSETAIAKQIAEGTRYLLAYQNGTPAGYCAFHLEERKTFLSKIYVRDACRRQGIATALFEQVRQASDGKEAIYLTVNKYNSGSIAAYKKLGFITVDAVVTDIGGGFVMDDYIMEKPL